MRDLKKVFLTAGAVAAVGVTASVGTFAGFTDSQAVAGNDFSSGTVDVQLNGSDSAGPFIQLANLVPGDSTSGSLKIENVGRNNATFELDAERVYPAGATDEEKAEIDQLAGRLLVTVKDGTDVVVSERSFAALNTSTGGASNFTVDLTALGASDEKTYTIEVRMPSDDDDDDYQGLDGLAEKFTVNAVQRAGTARTQNTVVDGE